MAKRPAPRNKGLAITFSVLGSAVIVLGLIAAGQSKPRKAKRKPAAVQQQPDPAFEHGFRVGFGMAKTGMIKPKSDELDAMSRQAALQMGREGGAGFKMVWKQGFSMGWSQGD